MKETAQILRLWRETCDRGEEAVLATVIHTRGSSYRLPGARLLLTNSQRAGSISGGCLEDDLVRRAWWLTSNGTVIRRYDTTADGEIGSGYGLGCNGIIHVLLERLHPERPNVLDAIAQVWSTRIPATVKHPSAQDMPAFEETVQPPVRLLVFGAGDDAIPLTEAASFLGWQVRVYDGRAHYARHDKFPHAEKVRVRQPGSGCIEVDPWTAAVLMSHSYSQDLAVLQELAANPPVYMGLLGPRKRSLQLLADAGLEESHLSPALHAPMGLDIGADGPQQVALAVVAEIQSFLNGRDGGALRTRLGSIHARDANEADVPFQVSNIACA